MLANADRFPVVTGGERGGKSFVLAALLLPHIVMLPVIHPEKFRTEKGQPLMSVRGYKPRLPHVILFGPTYAEPRVEFQYIQYWLEELGVLAGGINTPSKPQDGPWRMVTKEGVFITTWSMEDPRSIRSVDPDIAAVCEAGKAPYDGIERVQGRISGTRAFCPYVGTMEDSHQWFQDWAVMGKRENPYGVVSYSIPTWANTAIFPDGRYDEEILRLEAFYPEDVFAMRVAAEPRPPRNRVIPEATPNMVKKMRIPKDATIEPFVDPGYATAYAMEWVAIWEKEGGAKHFHVFKEFYEQRKTTEDMFHMAKKEKFWKRVKNGVIDIASKAHQGSGEPALKVWRKLAPGVSWNMKYWSEDAQRERLRTSIKGGNLTVDPSCRGLLAEFGLNEPVFPEMHHWKYNLDRDGRVIGEKPIDRWNHASKAVAYGLLHHVGPVEKVGKATSFNRLAQRQPAQSWTASKPKAGRSYKNTFAGVA